MGDASSICCPAQVVGAAGVRSRRTPLAARRMRLEPQVDSLSPLQYIASCISPHANFEENEIYHQVAIDRALGTAARCSRGSPSSSWPHSKICGDVLGGMT